MSPRGINQVSESRELSPSCFRDSGGCPALRFTLLLSSTSLLTLFLSFTAGCSYFNHSTANTGVDPLLGGPPVPAAGKTAPQQSAAPVSVLPPLSAPSSSSSPAALAAGPARPSDTSGDLRISNPQASSGPGGWVGRDPNPQRNGSGAVLLGVQASGELASRPDSSPVYNPVSLNSSQVTTIEQAQKILAGRGVLWQRPQPLQDNSGWEFSCAVQNRQNPNVTRTYTGKAPDLVGAMRAVIEQIDKDQ
jgi:hypothetical protein